MTDSNNDIDIHVRGDLSLRVRTGDDYPEGGNHLCYVDIIHDGEEIASINSPSKPWENFTRAMVSQIIAKRIDGYSSADAVNELMLERFEDHRAELDDVYNWE